MDLRHGPDNCLAPEGCLSTIHRTSSPCVVTISTEIYQLQILDAYFGGWVAGVARISSPQPLLAWRWAESRKCLSSVCKRFLYHHHETASFGIATRCWLDGPGIESQWGGEIFRSRLAGPRAHPASYTMGTGSFPGVKRPVRGVDYPPPSSAEVKERVELYLYSPSGLSWPAVG